MFAAVKVGSTNVTALAGRTLDHPEWEGSFELALLTVERPLDVLTPILHRLGRILGPLAPARLVVATGEVGRSRPALTERLRQWHPSLWILTGREEARATWWAAAAQFGGHITVIDVGGGSTEGASAHQAWSWPWGAARPPLGMPAPVHVPAGSPIIAAGGTARLLARWAEQSILDRDWVRQFALDPPAPERLRERLGTSALRSSLLPSGAAALHAALTAVGAPRCTVTARDLRHGLWLAAALGRGDRWVAEDARR